MLASTLRISLVAALLGSAALTTHAQEAKSIPVGAISYTLAAGTSASPKPTTLNVPLRDSVSSVAFNSSTNTGFTGASSGLIASVATGPVTNSSVITVTGAGWDAAQFKVAAQPYFLRVLSGASVGRTLLILVGQTGHTSTSVIVDNQGFAPTIAANDKFEIFPADTLKTFFADLVTAGSVLTGASASVADTVQVYTGTAWNTYFHNGTNWRLTTLATSQDNFVLRPDAAIVFNRRGTTAITFTALGTVPSTDQKVVVRDGGVTFVANVFPVARNLSTVGFQSLSGWASSTTAAASDKIQMYTGSAWASFYYYNNTAWRNATLNTASDPSVPVGRPFLISRTSSASTSSVQNFALPYTL